MRVNTDCKIILVVKDQQRKFWYFTVMTEQGAFCYVVGSLQEAIAHAAEEPHCGILIDIPEMVRAPDTIKSSVEDLLSGLPSATLNIHASSGAIRILPRSAITSTCSSIEQFVKVCAEFHPKIIFNRARKAVHLNALLDVDPEFRNPEKTVCIDISVGGCFLFCVRDDIVIDSTVWVKLPDSVSDTPVKCLVCWFRRWGTTQNIPGIGLKFETISEEVRKIIGNL